MIIRKFASRIKRKILSMAHRSKKTPTPLNQKSLLAKLEKADVVSFDIFDTLITRPTYTPEDIYLIIGEKFKIKDFKSKRIEADTIARTKLSRDINIDDIYEVLKTHYKIKNAEEAKAYEIELQLKLCIPRKDMLEIFNSLKSKGAIIILTSDMYLKNKTIIQMLKNCGYYGFSKLYLSNSLNARKDTKTIWQSILNDYPDSKIIHIGDNDLSDVEYPQEFGIKTIKIKSGKQLASESALHDYLAEPPSNYSDSLFWGTIINQFLFNSPFSQNPQINDLESLSYLFYGPLIESFFTHLSKNTKKTDKLLFLSREGYYLQNLYQEYCKQNHLPALENHYFLASRKATIFANFNTPKDISSFAKSNYYHGSLHNWFKQLLNIDIASSTTDYEITLPDDYEKAQPLIKKHSIKILQQSKLSRENYLLYIKQTVGNLNSHTIIVDLGYSGTIQYELSKMTKQNLSGIYLASSDSVKHYSNKSKLNFMFDVSKNSMFKKIYEYSLILEFVLSAPYGQLIGFEKQNKKAVPKYNNEKISPEKSRVIQDIIKYTKSYISNVATLKKDIPSYDISTESLFKFYTYCIEQNLISKDLKDLFKFTDDFTADEVKNVFKIINKY